MVSLPPIERERLTSAVRGRPRLLSTKLTMQVEVAIETANPFHLLRSPYPGPSTAKMTAAEWDAAQERLIEAEWRLSRYEWRDATWRDQLALARRGVLAQETTHPRVRTA